MPYITLHLPYERVRLPFADVAVQSRSDEARLVRVASHRPHVVAVTLKQNTRMSRQPRRALTGAGIRGVTGLVR